MVRVETLQPVGRRRMSLVVQARADSARPDVRSTSVSHTAATRIGADRSSERRQQRQTFSRTISRRPSAGVHQPPLDYISQITPNRSTITAPHVPKTGSRRSSVSQSFQLPQQRRFANASIADDPIGVGLPMQERSRDRGSRNVGAPTHGPVMGFRMLCRPQTDFRITPMVPCARAR
jgi:hypothetical protein